VGATMRRGARVLQRPSGEDATPRGSFGLDVGGEVVARRGLANPVPFADSLVDLRGPRADNRGLGLARLLVNADQRFPAVEFPLAGADLVDAADLADPFGRFLGDGQSPRRIIRRER